MRIFYSLIILTMVSLSLTACNTFHGMGQDISAVGHAMSHN